MTTSGKQTTEEIRRIVDNASAKATRTRVRQGYGLKRYVDVIAVTFATLVAVNALKKKHIHEDEMAAMKLREERLNERLGTQEEQLRIAQQRLKEDVPVLVKDVVREARAWKGAEQRCQGLIDKWIERGFGLYLEEDQEEAETNVKTEAESDTNIVLSEQDNGKGGVNFIG